MTCSELNGLVMNTICAFAQGVESLPHSHHVTTRQNPTHEPLSEGPTYAHRGT